ncbi:MAG: hypothetical protein FWD61_00245 [Phycisphaerales bacterium]|nr:hypothetical protein [Phycisphaerales bacterium]
MQEIAEKRTGLTFEEAVELRRKVSFPMTRAEANEHLRSRGYDCHPVMLKAMVEHEVVKPIHPKVWMQKDVEDAAEHIEDCGLFTPYAEMCEALGCRYADFLRALKAAAERESAKYGQDVPARDHYFVMHRMPPRGEGGADGVVKPAVLTFTLCADIRERLERGEPL